MWNDSDRREDGNDDLSEMINAYSQDNELRRKINELKKQKEEEQVKRDSEPSYQSFMKEDTQPMPKAKVGGIPDIRVDDTISKTRVGFEGDSAYDKTLVIMDSKTKSTFHDEESAEEAPIYEEPSEVYEEDNDAGKTMVTDFRTLKDAGVDMQDDDEEDEEAPRKNKGGKPDPEDNSKMNKIITYIIIGIVVVVILVAGGFGVKYALDNWLSSDTPTESKQPEEDKPNTKPSDNEGSGNESKDPEKPNIDDNSAEKARIQGELDSLEQQLAKKKEDTTKAEQAVTEAKKNRDSYNSLVLTELPTKLNEAKAAMDAAKKVNEEAQKAYKEADPKAENYDKLKQAANQAAAEVTTKEQAWKDLTNQLDLENKRYPTQMQTLEDALKAAEATHKAAKDEQTKLEQQVADKTTELNKYN